MMKIFEIPVYALTKTKLDEKVSYKRASLHRQFPHLDSDTYRLVDNHEILPFIEYHNHIIGYVIVYKTKQDIVLKRIISSKQIHRYVWDSSKKVLLKDTYDNGLHFRYVGLSNTQIIERLDEYIDAIKQMYPDRYYLDLESYNAVKKHMDILSIEV